MSYRVLIAVESCHKDWLKQQAIRDTWVKDVIVGDFFDYRFFIGLPVLDTMRKFGDEISLDVDDFYSSLSLKTQAICEWARQKDFDFVFKCDVDTIVNYRNLVYSGFENYDYMGGFNEDNMPIDLIPTFGSDKIQFASGGAGYWLSRKALTVVANHDRVTSCAEDVFVAACLKEARILPVWHNGYRWKPGETVDKNMVTLHLSSALQKKYEPKQMYEAYQKIKELENVGA